MASIAARVRRSFDPKRFLISIAPLADPASYRAYLLLGAMGLLALFSGIAGGFTVSRTFPLFDVAAFFGIAVFIATMLRRAGRLRISSAIETVAVTSMTGFVTSVALIPITAFSRPFADIGLASADRAIGFDWPTFYAWGLAHLSVFNLLRVSYRSFFLQSAALLVFLCLLGQQRRAWQVVTANAITLWCVALIYPLVPARGAAVHFGIPRSAALHGAFEFAPKIEAIQAGRRLIDGSLLGGLVSFPSFHAAVAVFLIWGAWKTQLRWPVAVASGVMFVGSSIFGGHYLVDLLAGAAIAWLAIMIAARTEGKIRSKPWGHE